MRAQLLHTLEGVMADDERVMVVLAGLGGFAFRQIAAAYPGRVVDVGISEQAAVGMAAGLAKSGFVPVVYTIAPFLAERALEQIKLDVCAQGAKVILVSVGASYDYSHEGVTHQCPADVPTLYNVPGMRILLPGTPVEVDLLLRQAIKDPYPYYIRLSERRNVRDYPAMIGETFAVQEHPSALGLVIAVGPVLAPVLQAVGDLRANVLYTASVRPLNLLLLRDMARPNILVVEPYYPLLAGELAPHFPRGTKFTSAGVKREFHGFAGSRETFDTWNGLDPYNLRTTFWESIAS